MQLNVLALVLTVFTAVSVTAVPSLNEVQAPQEAVKSTAIALVKVDSTFLPGSTTGATHWVAYGMSKGSYGMAS